MDQFLKVSGHDDLVRDTSSNAIINTNMAEYEQYMVRRKAKLEEKQLITKQAEEINSLKSDISEIKQMLQMLIKDR
jgi:hypothetical protein